MQTDFKYADLLDDDVFKLVFGQESSKDVMIEFLNQVIPDRNIVDLDFVDKEMHSLDLSRKNSVYDMFCRTDDGSRIVVEVQRRKQATYVERAIYYSTYQIGGQVASGAGDYGFFPVYVISILDFEIDQNKGRNDVKTVYRLYEEVSHTLLTDRLTFIFVELSKFNKTKDELSGDVLEGMYFCFKNMVHLKERPEVLDHDVFKKIFTVSELLNMDNVTRSKVLDKMTTERDLRNQMEYARKEAIEQGLTEGRERGIAEGRAEGREIERRILAEKLIKKGMSEKEVSELTGLTMSELSDLI